MRHPDWPERLADFIESRREEPFAYGTHDCCQFAASAVEAMTGDNPAAQWAYDSEFGANRLIVEAGGLEQLVTEAIGPTVHPSSAGRGDVVMAQLEDGLTVGVCLGRDCVFPAQSGLAFRPRQVIVTAWKVD